VLDLTDQDAPMLCEFGVSLVDSLTVHSKAMLSTLT
jgi:hypothetical protein